MLRRWSDWPCYSSTCRRDVQRLLRSGTSLTAYKANPKHGPEPRYGSWAWKCEREAERVHQVPHVVVCASGHVALVTLLKALYPSGGEIVTTALTFSSTVAAVIQAGLTPVFADVSIPGMTLDPGSAARMTNQKTVGYLPVDLFGHLSWAGENPVDACQSVGVRPVASSGVWSFNGRKNVPAGEGGAIFTHDPSLATICRLMIGHAENFVPWVGGNGHMNEVTACIASHGMTQVQARNTHRTAMARILNDSLALSDVILPDLDDHALYMYPLIVPNRMESIADTLFMEGVECQRGYIQPPLHRYTPFSDFTSDQLPNTESLSRDRLLLFPQVTPTATKKEMEELGEKIIRALGKAL